MDYGWDGGYGGKWGGDKGYGKGGYSLMDAWRDYGAQYMYEKGKAKGWKGGYGGGSLGPGGGSLGPGGKGDAWGFDMGGGYDDGGWYGYGKGDGYAKGMDADNGWSSKGDWGKGDWGQAEKGKGKRNTSAKGNGKDASGTPDFGGTKITEKIFVGSLPKTANSSDIGHYFEENFGPVKDVTLKYDANQMSRGFGFVTFESAETAQKVVDNHNWNMFNDKWIDCKPAVPEEEQKGKGKGKGGKQSDSIADVNAPVTEKLFVGSLPPTATEETIHHNFSQYGSIANIDMKFQGDGTFRGFCFITFETVEDAELVLDCKDTILFEGKPVDCKPAVEQAGKGSSAKGSSAKGSSAKGSSAKGSSAKGGKGKDVKGGGKHLAEKSVMVECLPMHATEDSVWKAFESEFGSVTGVKLENDETQDAQIGYVSFLLLESAKKVLKRYSDEEFFPIDFEGYMLECKPSPVETKGKGGTKGGSKGLSSPITEKIFVGNLPVHAEQEDIQRHYSQFGLVKEVFMKQNSDGSFKGYCYVTFRDVESAKRALEAGGNHFGEVRPFATNSNAKMDNPPPTTNVLKVTGLPTNQKDRDVFRFFYNFSVTRIRDTGDEIFIEFASESECKRAFTAKLGQKLGAHYAQMAGGTREEMQQAGQLQAQMAERQRAGKDGGRGDYGPIYSEVQSPFGPYG